MNCHGSLISGSNLSLGLKSKQIFDIPMVFLRMYDVTITTPDQVKTMKAIYLPYNYVVFSNTISNADGTQTTTLDCSDNGLLFRVVT